jgi:hypothetical protein
MPGARSIVASSIVRPCLGLRLNERKAVRNKAFALVGAWSALTPERYLRGRRVDLPEVEHVSSDLSRRLKMSVLTVLNLLAHLRRDLVWIFSGADQNILKSAHLLDRTTS